MVIRCAGFTGDVEAPKQVLPTGYEFRECAEHGVMPHYVEDDVPVCTKCHPIVDYGRKPYLSDRHGETAGEWVSNLMSDSHLTTEIEQAAEAAGINPATGKLLTLDDIIDRNVVKHSTRGKDTVAAFDGREIDVPMGCPVPGHLIKSTWCDWADGWYIYLVNGAHLQEQPGAEAPAVKHSIGYHSYTPGWHVFAEDGSKILSMPTHEGAYPSSADLHGAWAAYELHLSAEGTCTTCLGTENLHSTYGEPTSESFPCYACVPMPEVVGDRVAAHVDALVPMGAQREGSWWRYMGRDMVVQAHVGGTDTRGWVVLRTPTASERASMRRCSRARARAPRRVWQASSEGSDYAPVTMLDASRPLVVRAWRGSVALRWGVKLTLIYALGSVLGSLLT